VKKFVFPSDGSGGGFCSSRNFRVKEELGTRFYHDLSSMPNQDEREKAQLP